MSNSLSVKPNLVLSPFPHRTARQNPFFNRTDFAHKPFLRGSLSVAKFGFKPDPQSAEPVLRELFGQAENFLFTIADAAVSSSDTVTATKQSSDWLSVITNVMETVLKVLKDGLSTLHVPYSYGFAIILLTVLVKAATFPLTRKQVESAMAMRSLTPQIKAIQQRYAGDQERIQLETARLYKLAGINPLAGCLPTLATIPVWIGLYRALSNVADEGLLTEGFFWIPSLAGPTAIAARQSGSGISWLFPFLDGHPPLGWHDTLAYLVLPVLLVVSQYISVQIMQTLQSNDPNVKTSQALTSFLPLMIGYFSLSVPSGLSLYWFTNNILSTAQQIWLQKFGGAKNPMRQFSDTIKEEQLEIQKLISTLNSNKEGVRQIEKLTVEGLRPGERFKQLKEQEARKRREREEKRKAEEAAVKGNHLAIEEHKKERSELEEETGGAAILVDKKIGSLQSVTGQDTSNVKLVNGDQSSQELKKGENTISSSRMKDVVVCANSEVDRMDEQQSYEDLEKEVVEVSKSTVMKDNKYSEEDTHQARSEGGTE